MEITETKHSATEITRKSSVLCVCWQKRVVVVFGFYSYFFPIIYSYCFFLCARTCTFSFSYCSFYVVHSFATCYVYEQLSNTTVTQVKIHPSTYFISAKGSYWYPSAKRHAKRRHRMEELKSQMSIARKSLCKTSNRTFVDGGARRTSNTASYQRQSTIRIVEMRWNCNCHCDG